MQTYIGTFPYSKHTSSSPDCVISSIQLNSICCQGEGPIASLIILQERPEIVIHIRDCWKKYMYTMNTRMVEKSIGWIRLHLWCHRSRPSFTNNLTFFWVGDLHNRIRSIVLSNRLQISPLLSVSEKQVHNPSRWHFLSGLRCSTNRTQTRREKRRFNFGTISLRTTYREQKEELAELAQRCSSE